MRINRYHVQVLAAEVGVVVVACVVIFVVAWVRTLSQNARAQAFLHDVTELEIGKSTFNDARSVAQKYGGIPWWVNDSSMQCTYERCAFRFVFENKPLTSTHVVPYVGLVGTLTIKDGIVVNRSISYSRYARRPFAYNVIEAVVPQGDTLQARGVRAMMGLTRMEVDPEGTPSAVTIGLEPSASYDERRRAYALNLSCLSRILGCGTASAIFPADIPYRGVAAQTRSLTW